MKLLLLTLTVLVFLPQVIPDLRAKKCRQQDGRCKRSCNAKEEIKPGCKYRFGQVCCVLRPKGHPGIIYTVPKPPPTPRRPSSTFHAIVTVPPKNTPVFTTNRVTKNERPTQAVGTQVTLPPVS